MNLTNSSIFVNVVNLAKLVNLATFVNSAQVNFVKLVNLTILVNLANLTSFALYNIKNETFGLIFKPHTLFENYSKCCILTLAFSTNFCPIKMDLSGNTV